MCRHLEMDKKKTFGSFFVDYEFVNGVKPLWTNSMFGGMPSYQIATEHNANWLTYIDQAIKLGLPRPVGILFISMLGFYILTLCMRVNPWLGMIGAVAFGFSTINILYIGSYFYFFYCGFIWLKNEHHLL